MTRYLIRKIPSTLFVLVAASVIAFILPRLAPGDPAQAMAGPDATAEQVEAIREATGLDRPPFTQYVDWVRGLATGDLGRSYIERRPVAELIGSRVESTVELALLATVLMLLVGLALGVMAGVRRGPVARAVLDSVNTVLLATPPFLVGLVLILLFGITWRLLPVSGEVHMLENPGIAIQYLLLPALALAMSQGAVIARLLSTSMLVTRDQEFVDLAVATGASMRRVTWRHVVRNSLTTSVVAVGIRIGELLGGALVIESIFSRDGLGSLAVRAVQNRDYLVIQTLILGAVAIAIVCQLLTELVMAGLDPRVRLES